MIFRNSTKPKNSKAASDVKDLTTGSLWSGILFFSLPLIASNLLQILFNMSDIAVVGRFAGSVALGAVGSTTTLYTLYICFLIGMGAGANVIVARSMGGKHETDIKKTVHTALLICLMLGLFMMIVGEATEDVILRLLQTKPDLLPGALLYLRIVFLGLPALAIYNFGSAVFSAAGDTRKPLIFLAISGVLNVALNLLFVVVFHLDTAGVALATMISQYVSATCIIVALIRVHGPHKLHRADLKLDPTKAKILLKLCVPAGIQSSVFQIANLFIQYGVNTFDPIVVAGNAAAQNADSLVYDTMAAFYTACGSYIGQNYGAHKKDRMLKTYFVSLAYSFLFGLVLGVALAIFGRQFLSLFTTDPAVIDAGMKRLVLMGVCYGFSALMDNSIAASRGIGYTRIPLVIVIFGSVVLRIVWIYTIFAYFHTIQVLYLVFIVTWTISGILELLYFRKVFRRTDVGHAVA